VWTVLASLSKGFGPRRCAAPLSEAPGRIGVRLEVVFHFGAQLSYPMLPLTQAGEVLLVATDYEDSQAQWDNVPDSLGGHWDGNDFLLLGESGIRLRGVKDPGWDYLQGGSFPALVPEGSQAPVVALADITVTCGAGPVLLIDLREVPGRGVRVPAASLVRVLGGLQEGTIRFGELVQEMDNTGTYLGGGGVPSNATPTAVVRSGFPQFPAVEADEVTLLVRTDFSDPVGWRALLDELGGVDEDNMTDIDFDRIEAQEPSLTSLVVDDRAFESLQPGQVPALVAPGAQFTMVALADDMTMADPARSLLVVDLYDTPGHAIRVPLNVVGSMACNLEISNMYFYEYDGFAYE
jgi:hypothetical protein